MEERMTRETFRSILDGEKIPYDWFEHAPAFTCADLRDVGLPNSAKGVKNLFLYDSNKGKYFLVLVGEDRSVDLKALGKLLGVRLSFVSAEKMQNLLGVQPGSVTVFALLNDSEKRVQLVVDRVLWEECEQLQFHPMVNTASVVIARADVERLLSRSGHTAQVIEVP